MFKKKKDKDQGAGAGAGAGAAKPPPPRPDDRTSYRVDEHLTSQKVPPVSSLTAAQLDSLKKSLGSGWVDVDAAQHHLAVVMGLLPAGSPVGTFKWIFWSENPLSDALRDRLGELAESGPLESRTEPDYQFHWKG